MKTKSDRIKQSFLLIASVVALSLSLALSPLVKADQFDEQIKQLQADSYQDAINKLQSQIDAIRAQIQANIVKRDDLQNQIKAAEIELEKQKDLLGENIKAMYVEGEISTLEMLASSKDLSEFLDKQ